MPHRPTDGSFWDQRYAADAYAYGERPNAYLVATVPSLRPSGRVLVPGDGEGRNGVWLAERGFDVTTVDLSAVGVEKARRLAASRGVRVDAVQADLTDWAWPTAAFDAVVSVFLHVPPADRPALHRRMALALRPGGLLVLEGFTPRQLTFASGGPRDVDMLFTADGLARDLAGLADPVQMDECDRELDEGLLSGPAAVVRAMFRRGEGG